VTAPGEPPRPATDPELLMPFVVCRSEGGPYDDEAYVAGWELGELDHELTWTRPAFVTRYLHVANLLQADLVAMCHGYRLETPFPERDGWRLVYLTRQREDEEPE
jgi:hypothetical protein